MPPVIIELLRDILQEAEFLAAQAAQTTPDKFMANEVLKRALTRSIEIIGEATKKIPDEVRSDYPSIEWKKMAAMRDRLIHDYGGVDYFIVWDVAANKASGLASTVRAILASIGES